MQNCGANRPLTLHNVAFIVSLLPPGWGMMGWEAAGIYWHDQVLSVTTYKVPDRPAGIPEAMLITVAETSGSGASGRCLPPPLKK